MSMRQDFPALSLGGSASSRCLQGLHVLVVDDQEDARDLLAVALEGAGTKVTLAESAAVALRAMAETDIEILVSDIGMPEQDGYDLMRRLRASDGPARSRQAPCATPLPGTSIFSPPS